MDYNTPSADLLTHYEIHGSFTNVCENMIAWIKDQGLYKEQILAISTHETEIENGDALLVLLYRAQRDDATMTKIDNTLKYHLTKNVQDWD
jgi:hypothetical protein